MKYRRFGRLDWQVSTLGFGLECLPSNDSESLKMLRHAIDNGVNFIDVESPWDFKNNQRPPLLLEEALKDEDTLTNVLREVIPAYAKADVGGKVAAEINVSQSMKSRLLESTLRELSHSLKDKNAKVDVSHNLAKAGFECKIEGSTIEVSTESVTALLSEMIDPELQQFLEKAANK